MWVRHYDDRQPTYLEYRVAGGNVTFRNSQAPHLEKKFPAKELSIFLEGIRNGIIFAEIQNETIYDEFPGAIQVTHLGNMESHEDAAAPGRAILTLQNGSCYLHEKGEKPSMGIPMGHEWLGFCGSIRNGSPIKRAF